MASGAVEGEGNDGAREKLEVYKVYKRKGKGSKKRNEDDNKVAAEAAAKDCRNDAENEMSTGAATAVTATTEKVEEDNRKEDDSKRGIEGDPQALAQEDVNLAARDQKNSIEVPDETVAEEDINVVDKDSVEAPPGTLTHDDVDSICVDKNPSEIVVQENADVVDVGDNVTEAPSQTVAQYSVAVNKSSNEVPPQVLTQEDVEVVIVDDNDTEAPSQTLAQQDASAAPQHTDSGACAPTVNISIPKPPQLTVRSPQNLDCESVLMKEGSDGRFKINFASGSRKQKRELRRKLQSELVLVRGLVRRIEAKEGEIRGYGNSRSLVNDGGVNNGGSMLLSGVTSGVASREVVRPSRPLNQLSISVLENSQGANEHIEKEKRTPKANQFYRNSEFLLAKDKFPPAESNKKSKSNTKKQGGELAHGFGPGSKVYKSCSALLERLMKHKHGWVFNAPVDVKGLGLHDYFTIIKHPMDLGTVKTRLTKNWYKSPREFAEDVRLTFHNAMTYNPKGQDVHIMAEQLSKIFEDRWATIEADYNHEMRLTSDYELNILTPRSRQAPVMRLPPINVRSMVDRSEWIARPIDLQPKPASTPSGRTPSLKKPKANEPNKRDMTYEEKQKLSVHLQNLPSEKLDQIVHIVRKRNSAICQRDDEIEVDIDSVDAETLWELDRFITNYKKSLSKKKRKAELAIQARAAAEKNVQEKVPAPSIQELRKENNNAEMNSSMALPTQTEKENDNASRSSSSSSSTSGSSSSSDSDSDSSSSSGSDQT